MRKLTVAIDGPAGAGKSTIARRVAASLGYAYIDTGAMYRAVALKTLQSGVDLDHSDEVVQVAWGIRVAFHPGANGAQRVWMDGHDVTEAIRTPEVTALSSPVSAIPGVRKVLVAQQQAMGAGGGVVMEGRDIGTVVFPRAEVKVFLTASDEERARRRWQERSEKGSTATLEEVLAEQKERDTRDSTRSDSPLICAPDATRVDTDGLTIDEVVERVLQLCSAREGSMK